MIHGLVGDKVDHTKGDLRAEGTSAVLGKD